MIHLAALIVSAALASNGTGKTLVRSQPGTIVPSSGSAKPLIASSSTCDLTHLIWNGSRMVDLKASGWAQAGTVPQNPKAPPIPASGGVFSDANYYSLGTGADALDAATIAICVVVTFTSLPGSSTEVFVSNGLSNTDGFYWAVTDGATNNAVYFNAISSGSGTTGRAGTANGVLVGLNVVCGGFDGATNTTRVRLNLVASGTASKGSAMTAATSRVSYVGRYNGAGAALAHGKVHEVCASSATPTDALFAAVMNEVKAKTATTAW